MREERGKSFSIHDASPDRPDYRSGAYAVGDTRSYYTNASPGYTRKFEHEVRVYYCVTNTSDRILFIFSLVTGYGRSVVVIVIGVFKIIALL